jgi:hypothetical protein
MPWQPNLPIYLLDYTGKVIQLDQSTLLVCSTLPIRTRLFHIF